MTDDPPVLDVDPALQDVGEPEPSRVVQGLDLVAPGDPVRHRLVPVRQPEVEPQLRAVPTPSRTGSTTVTSSWHSTRIRELPGPTDTWGHDTTNRPRRAHRIGHGLAGSAGRGPTAYYGMRHVPDRVDGARRCRRPPGGDLAAVERAIAALEAQRAVLGDDVVETALAPLRERQAQLVSGQRGEQRKLVSVLFADLVDFTVLSRQLDAEDTRVGRRRLLRPLAGGDRGARRGRREVHRRRRDGGLRPAALLRGRRRASGPRRLWP